MASHLTTTTMEQAGIMEIEGLTMDPIEEASVSFMEDSTTNTAILLDMMSEEVDDFENESNILDQAAILSMDTIEDGNDYQANTASQSSPKNLKRFPAPTISPSSTTQAVKKPNIIVDKSHKVRSVSLVPTNHMQNHNHFQTQVTPTAKRSSIARSHLTSVSMISPLTENGTVSPSSDSLPTSNGATTIAESPTSVITPVGMTNLSGVSSIPADAAGNDSPSSAHMDYLEHEQRHRLRHNLDDSKDNDNEVTPEALLGRLQRDPCAFALRNSSNSNDENEGLISKRLQEIETKKVMLHQKRISLEEKLMDFVTSEKRMRVMICGSNASTMMNYNSSGASVGSSSMNLRETNSLGVNDSIHSAHSILRSPNPSKSPNSLVQHRQNISLLHTSMEPSYNNGDELVQDMPWTDPRTSEIAYIYSGPLNKLKQPHGWGTMKFLDGQIYEGQIYAGYRFGMGTNRWPDGQVYVGEWEDHSRNGRGTHTWRDGRRVTGQWRLGHLDGRVLFSWPNGASFEGDCRMGKKHGRGTHTFANGRLYKGNFVKGKEEGFGCLSQGDWKYRGQFKAGKREGYGIQIWRNKTYDGEWKANKAHGKGRIVWQNGSTYTGEFCMGRYHGLGVYVWPNGKRYVGSWENSCKHGQGLYTFPSGKKYDGNYTKGVKDGYGRMIWPDGRMFCGSWKNGKRDGRGIQTNPDGSLEHCGIWKNDKPYFKGERESPSNSLCSDSSNGLSFSNASQMGYCDGGLNTSEEDIVFMEAQTVAAADDSFHHSRSPTKVKVETSSPIVDLPAQSKSMSSSPYVKSIPATPTKDDVSSIGTTDQDVTPDFLLTPMERISL